MSERVLELHPDFPQDSNSCWSIYDHKTSGVLDWVATANDAEDAELFRIALAHREEVMKWHPILGGTK